MITQQEVLNSLARAEVVRFKEKESSLLYAATMLDDDHILVWPLPIVQEGAELLPLNEFVERFDESYI